MSSHSQKSTLLMLLCLVFITTISGCSFLSNNNSNTLSISTDDKCDLFSDISNESISDFQLTDTQSKDIEPPSAPIRPTDDIDINENPDEVISSNRKISSSTETPASATTATITTNNDQLLLYGICFGPNLKGAKSDTIPQSTIQNLIDTLKPNLTYGIRTFGSDDSLSEASKYAHTKGLKVLSGAWLDKDKAKNDIEIENLIKAAKSGYIDMAAVGNETLLRGDLTPDELIVYIKKVKEALKGTGIPVSTVDIPGKLLENPKLVAECDFVGANIYPFWGEVAIDKAMSSLTESYKTLQDKYPDKEVIITETGWPSAGNANGAAIPSLDNERYYFKSVVDWTNKNNIKCFYFSAFDEEWKTDEGGINGVGTHWGIYDSSLNIKKDSKGVSMLSSIN